MSILLWLHSLTRWLVVITAVVAIITHLLVVIRSIQPSKAVWQTMSVFTIFLSIQFVLGILVLITSWNSASEVIRYRMEHAVIGLIAVSVGHASAMWRKRGDTIRARNNLIDMVVVLIIIFVGVSLLPGGWSRPFLPILGG